MLNDEINAPEVAGGLNNLIVLDDLTSNSDPIGLKNIACLLFGKTALFDTKSVATHMSRDTYNLLMSPSELPSEYFQRRERFMNQPS